jgi:hypothetical protein
MPANVDRLKTALEQLIQAVEQFALNAQNARDFEPLSSSFSYLYSLVLRAKNAL